MIPAQTKLSGLGSIPSKSCIPNPIILVLAACKSIGELALNIFWDLCWFVLKKKNKEKRVIVDFEVKESTYFPRFFHLAKNDSPFISVGSKNLFIVSGSLIVIFWGMLLQIKLTTILGASKSIFSKTTISKKKEAMYLCSHLCILRWSFVGFVLQLRGLVLLVSFVCST